MREKILSVLALMSISQAFAQDKVLSDQTCFRSRGYRCEGSGTQWNLLELCRVFFLGIRNDQKEKTTCRLG